jgi:hypothetical protein
MLVGWMRGLVVVGVVALACELEGDPPTLVPLAQADEALVDAYCERMFECRCEQGRRFDEMQACRAWVDERVATLRMEAELTGLTYDPACIGITVDRLDDLRCAATVTEDGDDETCTLPCYPLHGDVLTGGACTRTEYSGYSDCAQGLECSIEECDGTGNCTGACYNPCFGECESDCGDAARCIDGACMPLPGVGESCGDYGCAEGLDCDYGSGSGTCRRRADLGESCTDIACAEDLRCDFDNMTGEGTCVGPTALGDACMGHQECESGYCPAGFCDELPGEGDSCAGTFACEKGLDCDSETMKCVDGDAIVCQLSIDVG